MQIASWANVYDLVIFMISLVVWCRFGYVFLKYNHFDSFIDAYSMPHMDPRDRPFSSESWFHIRANGNANVKPYINRLAAYPPAEPSVVLHLK